MLPSAATALQGETRLAPPARVLPSAPRRPGDAYARVEASLCTKRKLALAAAEASVPIDVAATLVSEAAVLLERLGGRRLRSPRELLDRAAGTSRVACALSASHADYLRALSCRSFRRQVAELDVPSRVAGLLGDRADELLGRCELLEEAIAWERASLLSERTMGTWGTGVVLGGLR